MRLPPGNSVTGQRFKRRYFKQWVLRMIRLLTLNIRNFRGIKTLDLDLKGRNASFVGPNGSGKSSVVDALDFLFTGGIRRLEGEGAGDLSLQKHGPHIDAEPKDATVEATFRVDDKPEP